MRRLLLLSAALALAAPALPATAQTAPSAISYVEAELLPDGEIVTRTNARGRANARYEAGSISKFACTLAALDLQRAGRLRLTDTLATLLPDYSGAHADRITLEQLLQNRSGIADGLMAAVRADPAATLALDLTPMEAVNRFGTRYTEDAPGTAFDYAILNWTFVQAILERASGQSIHDALRERVYEPAGMASSTSFTGTLPGPDPVRPLGQTLPIPPYLVCAGGTAATPADLIRLLRHPYTPSYPEADRRALETVASPESHYGLGGRTRSVTVDGVMHQLSWKSGSNGAFKSRAVYDLVTDTGYAIMTNEDAVDLVEQRQSDWVRERLGVTLD